MKNLIIIGAGGCGREVLQWAKDINKIERKWNIKGFLDDNQSALENIACDIEIIAGVSDYVIEENDVFVCSIGNSKIRKNIMIALKQKGAEFVNIIHPTAVVSDTADIGNGVILYPYSIISPNTVIGKGAMVNMHSTIAHDSTLGDFCTISAHCDITGMCKLGDEVFMGTSSHIIPETTIGNNVYICAGSTVMTKLRNNVKVIGNPAKRMTF